jgi:hypothetical protein
MIASSVVNGGMRFRSHLSPRCVKAEPLLKPARLYSLAELQREKGLPPTRPGVYAWYFDEAPSAVPIGGCHRLEDGRLLLYIGIAPSRKAGSKSSLRTRIVSSHFRGTAEGSTLRLTLGCLLAQKLGLRLRRLGSTRRFGKEGEGKLTAWMADHARVCWIECENPWELEEELIANLTLPLNLDQNRRHPFHASLSALRSAARRLADEEPPERS